MTVEVEIPSTGAEDTVRLDRVFTALFTTSPLMPILIGYVKSCHGAQFVSSAGPGLPM